MRSISTLVTSLVVCSLCAPTLGASSKVKSAVASASTPVLAAVTKAKANTFAVVGLSGASAQQMFLGTPTKVYIVDKTENNPAQVAGHPAWATEYDLVSNTFRSLDIKTNAFCAGGNLMGNGSWLNVGGNNGVTTLGIANDVAGNPDGGGAYDSFSGGRSTRVMTPCSDSTCNWTEDTDGIPVNRWYPSLETLEDGTVIILGGELYGGFVNSVNQNQSVPTYEFWPSTGAPILSPFLQRTQPANLYPLTWLLPSGLIFMQADWQTTLLNYTSQVETALPNITHAQRTYPASGATTMLPLTVRNNYEATILFCGGMDPVRDDWDNKLWDVVNTDTSNSCVSIAPDSASPNYVDEDPLPENRGMGNFIQLPDERLFLVNGVSKGSAGYGYDTWAVNQSYAKNPVFRPAYYNHSAPAGKRFDTNVPSSTIGRLYHSSATLLPDGSVFISGSNPNADVIPTPSGVNASYVYHTEYRTEIFYPSYYDAVRPLPTGIPTTVTYGGRPFNLNVPNLKGVDLNSIKVALIRTGFSTHAMNMGQRYIQLNSTFTGNTDFSATLHVSQLPPNAALLVPGPALLFVIVNGIPSIGQFVMVGSGQLGRQPMLARATLEPSSGNFIATGSSTGTNPSSPSSGTTGSTTGGSTTASGGAGTLGSGAISLGGGVSTLVGIVLAIGVLVL